MWCRLKWEYGCKSLTSTEADELNQNQTNCCKASYNLFPFVCVCILGDVTEYTQVCLSTGWGKMSHIQTNKRQPVLVLCISAPPHASLQNYFPSFNFPYHSQQDVTTADMELFKIKPSTVNPTHFKDEPGHSHPHSVPSQSHLPLFSPQPATLPQYLLLSVSHFIWAWGETLVSDWDASLWWFSLWLIQLLHSHFRGSVSCWVKTVCMSLCICLDYVKLWCMCF